MKKLYQQPAIEVVETEVTALIAASILKSDSESNEITPTDEEYSGIFQ